MDSGRHPDPRAAPAAASAGIVIVIIIFVVGAGRRAAGADHRGRRQRRRATVGDRPLQRVPDRCGRQRERRLRPGPRRELAARLLGRRTSSSRRATPSSPPRSSRSPRPSPPAAAAAPAPRSDRSTARSTSTIYLDSTFFADVLEGQLGGRGGDFVEPYVLAHEYGHHIQNLLGTMGKVKTQQGPRERRGPAGAPGRLLRRHVDQGRDDDDGRQGREDLRRDRPCRHRRGDRRGQDRRRRPDPAGSGGQR